MELLLVPTWHLLPSTCSSASAGALWRCLLPFDAVIDSPQGQANAPWGSNL